MQNEPTESVRLNVRVSPALAAAIKRYGEREDMRQSEAIRSLLRSALRAWGWMEAASDDST